MKKIAFLLMFLGAVSAYGQTEREISYSDYMQATYQNNIGYAAEKLNMSIATATISAAKVFSDPTLSLEYANNSDWWMQMGVGYSAELSKNFAPGLRRSRIDLARSESALTEALLADFLHNLRADATIAYLLAIKSEELYHVKHNAYNNMRQLAVGDSIRYALGKIGQVDAMQSRVQAGIIGNDMLASQADLQSALLSLSSFMSRGDTLYRASGSLSVPTTDFTVDQLLTMATENRADLVAAMASTQVAGRAVTVTRRTRGLDFDIALGYNHNREVRNELAPAPKFNGFTVGLSLPLKFSSANKGELQVAKLEERQAQLNYQAAKIEVERQVRSCFATYRSLCDQVKNYESGMLSEAKMVLDGKIYSYSRGESSLLEVLTAESTYDDLRSMYIETLFNHAVSLVELQRSSGSVFIHL